MSILHTVNKSPFETGTLKSCLGYAKAGDGVLLFEDGVYGAIKGTSAAGAIQAAQATVSLYVLGADLEARGISQEKLLDGVTVVDYGGFVDLAAEHKLTEAWL